MAALSNNLVLTLAVPEGAADQTRLVQAIDANNRNGEAELLQTYFNALAAGVRQGKLTVGAAAVTASGTVTLASMVATDTVTVNGVSFACVASGATGNQFNVGGTDTLTAVALAAAINASVTALVAGYVVATASGPVVTVSAAKPGLLGNLCTLAISAHGSVSGAVLSGGTAGTEVTYTYGS